jgi:8-oxo-dGTP diphosphatase
MKHIKVVAAIIYNENKILCVQRSESKLDYISKKYEFPGGKIESGEEPVDALKREILEELKMEIKVESHFLTIEHEYPDFTMEMQSYICYNHDRMLTLTEHLDFKWLKVTSLNALDWAAADLPIVHKLISNG